MDVNLGKIEQSCINYGSGDRESSLIDLKTRNHPKTQLIAVVPGLVGLWVSEKHHRPIQRTCNEPPLASQSAS